MICEFTTSSSYKTMELNGGFRYSQSSDASDGGSRHLALVFFDVLMLDSSSLLCTPYSTRRSILESLIEVSHGRAMLAERTSIELNTSGGIEEAESGLMKIFAGVIADHQEGVVLKAEKGGYNDWRSPWVKVSIILLSFILLK
jgi:DNA ligase 4